MYFFQVLVFDTIAKRNQANIFGATPFFKESSIQMSNISPLGALNSSINPPATQYVECGSGPNSQQKSRWRNGKASWMKRSSAPATRSDLLIHVKLIFLAAWSFSVQQTIVTPNPC